MSVYVVGLRWVCGAGYGLALISQSRTVSTPALARRLPALHRSFPRCRSPGNKLQATALPLNLWSRAETGREGGRRELVGPVFLYVGYGGGGLFFA